MSKHHRQKSYDRIKHRKNYKEQKGKNKEDGKKSPSFTNCISSYFTKFLYLVKGQNTTPTKKKRENYKIKKKEER